MIRIGYGYDVHQLVPDRALILGGVPIPYHMGLLGHSDADVLIHAIIDAILGAAAYGDIGSLYPDHDTQYKNIDSRILLRDTYTKIMSLGYQIGNIDATICAQKPKLKDYIPLMRATLAADLQCEISQISVKATTEEGLGISGSEKGMSASAVVLIESSP